MKGEIMKKLLLVLMVVALAAVLLVGCTPVTPAEGEGEGEGGICPAVTISSQQAVGTKTYIKGGTQTITVTFAVPTEPVSVWLPYDCNEKGAPDGVPADAIEIVMYPNATKTVYTGEFNFGSAYYDDNDLYGTYCCEFFVYVVTCNTCAPCKAPFIVDNEGPDSEIEITTSDCICEGCNLIFKTPTQSEICDVTGICCGDYCSGFGSYSIDLYTSDPFDECCDVPCVTPAYSCTGVACPVNCTLACIPADEYWVVVNLLDAVGNRTRYYAIVDLAEDCTFTVTEYEEDYNPIGDVWCTSWTVIYDTDTTIGWCVED
jgi:uncharacterized protein YceK